MRIVQKEVLKKFKEIAKKNNVDVEDVVTIDSSIWKMVTSKMSEGNYDDENSFHNIYIYGLGTFYFNPYKWRYINNNRNKKYDKDTRDTQGD